MVPKKKDLESLEFPENWAKLKEQPPPSPPKDVWVFLQSFPVSREELLRSRPIKKRFVLPD